MDPTDVTVTKCWLYYLSALQKQRAGPQGTERSCLAHFHQSLREYCCLTRPVSKYSENQEKEVEKNIPGIALWWREEYSQLQLLSPWNFHDRNRKIFPSDHWERHQLFNWICVPVMLSMSLNVQHHSQTLFSPFHESGIRHVWSVSFDFQLDTTLKWQAPQIKVIYIGLACWQRPWELQ